jgi:hypothetical protein
MIAMCSLFGAALVQHDEGSTASSGIDSGVEMLSIVISI